MHQNECCLSLNFVFFQNFSCYLNSLLKKNALNIYKRCHFVYDLFFVLRIQHTLITPSPKEICDSSLIWLHKSALFISTENVQDILSPRDAMPSALAILIFPAFHWRSCSSAMTRSRVMRWSTGWQSASCVLCTQ